MALRYAPNFGSWGTARAPQQRTQARAQLIRSRPRSSFGVQGDVRGFGAESFTHPGVTCSVEEIDKAGGDTWKNFCDCAFLEPGSVPVWQYNGNTLMAPPGMGGPDFWMNPAVMEIVVQAIPNYDPAKMRLTQLKVESRGEDWNKCMSKQCLIPTGCWNGSKADSGATWADSWDRLNIHPGMLFAPWTELGAGARGIPKRNAGFWYGVAAFTSIDLGDYRPIRLFVLKLTNPAKYAFLVGFASIFGMGAVVASLDQEAIAEALVLSTNADGRDYLLKKVILPLAQFGMGVIGVFLGMLGGGVPGAIAAVIKLQAQQILGTGQAPVDPGPVLGVLQAIANYGEQLADLFNPTKWAQGSTWRLLGRLVGDVAAVFGPVGTAARDTIAVVAAALMAAGSVMENIQDGSTLQKTLDDLCVSFFGFTMTQFTNASNSGQLGTLLKISNFNAAQLALFTAVAPALLGVLGAMQFFADALAWLATFFGGWDMMAHLADSLRVITDFLGKLQYVRDVVAAPPPPAAAVPASSGPVGATRGLTMALRQQAGTQATSVSSTTGAKAGVSQITPAPSSGGGAGLAVAAGIGWLLLKGSLL